AWFLSPLLAGILVGLSESYHRVYIVSGLILIPLLFLVSSKFTERYSHYKSFSFWQATKRFILKSPKQKDVDINRILIIDFIFQFFLAILVIFVPIYLNEIIGFDWPEIGFIITIALIP